MPSLKVKLSNLLLPEKAFLPSIFTPGGRVKEVKAQPSKTSVLMVVSEAGRWMELSFEHRQNARWLKVVMPSGSVMLSKLVQF